MSWETGGADIERLLQGRELEHVPPDIELAKGLLTQARNHIASAKLIKDSDPEGAYAALYDAARKGAVALLQAQGLRPTSKGGHVAVKDAVRAQFADLTGGEVLRSLDRLRRRRNEMEYPSVESAIDTEELDEAIQRSVAIVEFSSKLVPELPVYT